MHRRITSSSMLSLVLRLLLTLLFTLTRYPACPVNDTDTFVLIETIDSDDPETRHKLVPYE
jgi:hypothetical protein